jgi:deoxyribodipyrimidine photolyase-related protein
MKLFLIYPHQIFEDISLLKTYDKVFLIEDPLFFTQYTFHKQKLIFHRATMKAYENFLKENNILVQYIEHSTIQETRDIVNFFPKNISQIGHYDFVDDWLYKKVSKALRDISVVQYDTSLFILTHKEVQEYPDKQNYSMNSFYIEMRKKLNILIDEKQKPVGGSWSFDSENRKKIPKGIHMPSHKILKDKWHKEASEYIEKYFKNNYGETDIYMYVHTFEDARAHMFSFFKERFENFGPYEDAIIDTEHILFHSVLSPLINIGLLTPHYVIEQACMYAQKNNIPLNSLEGFVRQIIGWREFMRLMYIKKGRVMRTSNFFNHTKKLPETFWSGHTKIVPIDTTISKVLQTAYCHHIERLMIMSNYMLLAEYHPDQVYKWFMELFIDAYDWVMVPNVYGMGQYADGGIFATKPYISGSNYILKMSNYTKGIWTEEWNDLYWNFIEKNAKAFSKNPRMSLIVSLAKKRAGSDPAP